MFSVPPRVFWPYCAAVVSLAVAIAAFWKPAARASGLDKLRALAPAAYAIPLVIFGADHLSSVKEVMRIVPSWMPGKMFWTIFVGAALILAGFSILLGIRRQLSTTLLGIMFFLFEALMHIPSLIRLAAGGHLFAPDQRGLLGVAGRDFAFGCGAFVLAVAASRADLRHRIERYACRGMAVVASCSASFISCTRASLRASRLRSAIPIGCPAARPGATLPERPSFSAPSECSAGIRHAGRPPPSSARFSSSS